MKAMYQSVNNEILSILISELPLKEMINNVVEVIHRTNHFAVAVRLKENGDFPYYAYAGFSEKFIIQENSLIAKSEGCTIGAAGTDNPCLECTCGLVVKGNSCDLLTEHGSFWTNKSFDLLNIPSEDDPRFRPRNRCVHAGYGSLAIIPIRAHGAIIGTLQLNEYRTGAFTHEIIKFFERVSLSLGIAIMRKQAEESLIDSEVFLKEVQTNAHIGGYKFDIIQNRWECNHVMSTIFGIDPSYDKTFENWVAVVHPDCRQMMANYMLEEVLGKRQPFNKEYRIKRINDGVERWVLGFGNLNFDEAGVPVSMVGTIMDITEKKIAEIERDFLIDRLTKRNVDLEQFSYIVSHNLRAPVANLIGLSDQLIDPLCPPEESRTLVEYICKSVSNLDGIIKDLNTVLNINNGMSEKRSVVSLTELTEDIKNHFGELLERERVQIISDFSEVNEVLTIKSYMFSLFFNLVSNSIKYRKQSADPIIEISTHRTDSKIVLVFRDNGIGIDLKLAQNKIFGLYKRFHTHVEGKGMGLFMTKTQVELLGGTLDVASEVEVGTTFKISFKSN